MYLKPKSEAGVLKSCSTTFMLPVATPPNGIVFVNPAVTRRDMLLAGAPLGLIGLSVTVVGSRTLGSLPLG